MGRRKEIDTTQWPAGGPHRELLEILDRLHKDSGLMSRHEIATAMQFGSPSHINDWLRARRLPDTAKKVRELVRALNGGENDIRRAAELYEAIPRWAAEPKPHPWARLVGDHVAWTLTDPGQDVSGLDDAAAAVAERLGALSDEAEAALAGDPWLDSGFADRFAAQTERLLRTMPTPDLRDLSPAEAVLLTLVPLLQHAHVARTLAGLREIDPHDLTLDGGGGPRRDYEVFLSGQREHVDRATAPDLPGRASAGTEIGWWLFHRWTARGGRTYRLGAVRDLVGAAEITDSRLRDGVLEPRTVRRIMIGLRLGPAELGDPDRADAPRTENTLFAGSRDEQRVRERLIGHILAVAYALTIDLVRLPDVVVRHLGIPEPVDLRLLRGTVASRAQWVIQRDRLVLRADCHHPAEYEGLRQYAGQVDTLLDMIRRTCGDHPTLQSLAGLPARASADEVRPDTDDDGRLLFQRVSRFRLDERRVQELLMGEQLYQDRGLAIRELYQNALDACRYRRARHAYRARFGGADSWNGQIRFTQGEENGRAFLECADTGIGMTEAVLTEVFSQAGTRFTDMTEFMLESAAWQDADPPIPFHANSRFGIGVLSYFMIADEIEVVTRPLDHGDHPHPTMRVSIFGPGHLFRIEHLPPEQARFPGTTVKLYLRDSNSAPSCVEELRRLLGIAEFETTAVHGAKEERWEPGVLKSRARLSWENEGLDTHGRFVPWTAENGCQVIWCEKGGGLLVDGLHVQPAVRRGVFAGLGDGTLRGAVVNLTGPKAPKQLSVDRRKVLSDVSADVEELLESAMGCLLSEDTPLMRLHWISAVTEASPRLADRLAKCAAEGDRSIDGPEQTGESARDCFLQDTFLTTERYALFGAFDADRGGFSSWDFGPYVPDHVLLWRLAARDDQRLLDLLEAGDLREAERGIPSDVILLAGLNSFAAEELSIADFAWPERDLERQPGHILWTAMVTGSSPREAARRAIDLGYVLEPQRFPEGREFDGIDLALLGRGRGRALDWWDTVKEVPLGHLVAVAVQYGLRISEVRDRMEGYGFRLLPDGPFVESPTPVDLRLLNWEGDGRGDDWIRERATPLPASHLVQSAADLDMEIGEVCARIEEFGLPVERLALPVRPSSEDLFLFDWAWGSDRDDFDTADALPPGIVARVASMLDRPIREVGARLTGYGVKIARCPLGRVGPADLSLLSRYGGRYGSWRPHGDVVSLPSLLRASRLANVPPSTAAERLAAYGLEVPAGVRPAVIDEITSGLLGRCLAAQDGWPDVEPSVFRAHVLRAAAMEGVSPHLAADRLRTAGVALPPGDWADQTDEINFWLLRSHRSAGPLWLQLDKPVPLLHLLRGARKFGISVEEAAERLRRLGMIVPDVRTSVAEALRRVPRRA
ncbi:wHTH domain-containing protein [Actinomadura roseirufa]|uniref:wHTH domain-containing protein n=1 Tax=Actinomadura roseirufa TaxID=2094049 RepID=UPI0010417E23|nr:hypothetical protein [Actinomadura roseirufa]